MNSWNVHGGNGQTSLGFTMPSDVTVWLLPSNATFVQPGQQISAQYVFAMPFVAQCSVQ